MARPHTRSTVGTLVTAGLALMAVGLADAAGQAPPQKPPAARAASAAPPAPASKSDDTFTMALTGDSIITRKLSVYAEPAYTRLIDLLRGADVAFTNLEMLFHDYEPWAMNEGGGTYMRADPALAQELVWAGFDMVSRANNHTGDYGVLGMRLTTQHTAKTGLVQAGVGESLPEAREAKFLETARGRVALVSVASTYPDHARAGRTRGDMPARPGLNPLRFTTTYLLPRDQFEAMRSTFRGAGVNLPASGDSFSALSNRFAVGDKPDVRTEARKEDLTANAAVVRNAASLADYVIVSMHGHENYRNRTVPAQFQVEFARAMIDAGADVVVGHGPHVLRGVEIYKGKPILYSVGDFIFQNDTLQRLPSENYEPYDLGPDAYVNDFNDRRYDFDKRGFPADREIWEGVVAVPRWKGRALVDLRLYPVTLGFQTPRTVRGRPMLAEGDAAKKIIDDLVRMSSALGTTVDAAAGVAVVRVPGERRRP